MAIAIAIAIYSHTHIHIYIYMYALLPSLSRPTATPSSPTACGATRATRITSVRSPCGSPWPASSSWRDGATLARC